MKRLRWSGLAVVLALGLAPAAPTSSVAASAAASARLRFTAYVASGETIVPVNTRVNAKGAAIPVGADALALTPDGRTLLAANASTGMLTPVSTDTGRVGTAFPRGGIGGAGSIVDMAVSPNGRTAWLTTRDGSVVPVNLRTRTAGAPITVGTHADGIALTPDGSTAYVVTEFDPGTVIPVDTATRRPGAPIIVGNVPRGISMTPNGETALVANTGQVWLIDTATNTPERPIADGDLLNQIAVTPDGTKAYVTDDRHQEWSVIDVRRRQFITRVDGGEGDIAITPDAATAYIVGGVGGVGGVIPVDTATQQAGEIIPFAAGVRDIAVRPAQAPNARFAVKPAPHGSLTAFDGAASTAGTGRIVRYAWRFGDGTRASTDTPVIGHRYASAGTYTVRLTVTDSAGTSTRVVFTGQTVSRNGGPGATVRRQVSIP